MALVPALQSLYGLTSLNISGEWARAQVVHAGGHGKGGARDETCGLIMCTARDCMHEAEKGVHGGASENALQTTISDLRGQLRSYLRCRACRTSPCWTSAVRETAPNEGEQETLPNEGGLETAPNEGGRREGPYRLWSCVVLSCSHVGPGAGRDHID